MDNSIQPGEIFSDRYQILRQLGSGNGGQTYLAQDRHRFYEACLLKEFTFERQNSETAQKIEVLLEEEAKALYGLQHPQVPRFLDCFRFHQDGKVRLFLVQDYVQGQTYREILNQRLQDNLLFSEAEVTQLLLQILPVLQYIHSRGVIHQAICPEHLIERQDDCLPVLIEFAGIEEIAAIADSPQSPTKAIGKKGYAPEEQIQYGLVFPHSDLYALAATILVLLTGKDLSDELNPHSEDVSPKLKRVLSKMLAKAPGDRFHSATEVLQSLNAPDLELPSDVETESVKTQTTAVVATDHKLYSPLLNSSMASPSASSNSPSIGCLGKIAIVLILSLGAGVLGWFAGKTWVKYVLENPGIDNAVSSATNGSSSSISDAELQRKTNLRTRRSDLGIDSQFFSALVDQVFSNQYPNQQGRVLSDTSEDAQWRERWDKVAMELLDKLPFLSPEALRGLGSYTQADRDHSKQEVNLLHLSSRSLYDLADATFFYHFPEQKDQEFMATPLGQVWTAIILDKLKALRSPSTYEKVDLALEGSETKLAGNLPPGEGKAYVVRLEASQVMQMQLNSDQDTLLSIYSPTGENNLLEDSSHRQWSGELPESGYYELIIVSQADKPLDYQLNLKVAPQQ